MEGRNSLLELDKSIVALLVEVWGGVKFVRFPSDPRPCCDGSSPIGVSSKMTGSAIHCWTQKTAIRFSPFPRRWQSGIDSCETGGPYLKLAVLYAPRQAPDEKRDKRIASGDDAELSVPKRSSRTVCGCEAVMCRREVSESS